MNAPRPERECPNRELAVGWALHCLEPAEESLFAAHLADCDECRQSVREAEEVSAALAVNVPDALPPPSLERAILAAAEGGTDHADDDVEHDDDSAQAAGAGGKRRADVAPLRRRATARPARRSTGRLLTAAAVVALVAVAGVLGIRVAQLDAERDRVAQQVASMSQLVERMAGSDARAVTLAGNDGRPMAMLVAEPGRVTLLPMGLPSNSPSETYVLWGLGTGTPEALDAFDVATDSTVVHTVNSAPRAEAFSAFAVSIEPGRTPPPAPSDVVATGEVDS